MPGPILERRVVCILLFLFWMLQLCSWKVVCVCARSAWLDPTLQKSEEMYVMQNCKLMMLRHIWDEKMDAKTTPPFPAHACDGQIHSLPVIMPCLVYNVSIMPRQVCFVGLCGQLSVWSESGDARQRELEGGRNCLWHQKEHMCMTVAGTSFLSPFQPIQAKTAMGGTHHFLCQLSPIEYETSILL